MDLDTLKDTNLFFYKFKDSINKIYVDDVNGFRRGKH